MRTLAMLATMTLAMNADAPKAVVDGLASSAVRVIAYEDLQCPDCATFRKMLDEKLLAAYGAKVAFEHRDFPLPKHSWARPGAVVARFFHEVSPDLGIDWRRHLLFSIRATTSENFLDRLKAFASQHGVAPERAVAALEEARYREMVEKDCQDGVSRGVSRTPTLFVDGQPFVETFTFEQLSKAIDAALAGR
jgi:protein-disulfide isomerase